MGVFPYQALDMGIYDTLKTAYLEKLEQQEVKQNAPSMFVLWGCGIVSGSIGASSVYPLSMIRTRYVACYLRHLQQVLWYAKDNLCRLQAQGTPGAAWACARATLRNEGLVGFYAGLTPTLIKVCRIPALKTCFDQFSDIFILGRPSCQYQLCGL